MRIWFEEGGGRWCGWGDSLLLLWCTHKVQTLQSLPKHESLPFQTQLLICCTAHMKMKMKMMHFSKTAQELFSKNWHENRSGNGDKNSSKTSTLNPPFLHTIDVACDDPICVCTDLLPSTQPVSWLGSTSQWIFLHFVLQSNWPQFQFYAQIKHFDYREVCRPQWIDNYYTISFPHWSMIPGCQGLSGGTCISCWGIGTSAQSCFIACLSIIVIC